MIQGFSSDLGIKAATPAADIRAPTRASEVARIPAPDVEGNLISSG